MHFTYVLQSVKVGKWYAGMSGDLRMRMAQHEKGQVESTRSRRPLRLVYYEACLTAEDAHRRESYLKTGRGKKFLRQRLSSWIATAETNQLERE